jgi:DNA-binding YbaB/EbfC family protein
MKDLSRMLKQLQDAQNRMAQLQEELSSRTVEAASGGGMVKVVANGRQEILSLRIDPQVIDPKDPEMLEDLVVAAVNEARARVDALVRDEMGRLPG